MDKTGQGFSLRPGSSRSNRRKNVSEMEETNTSDEALNFRIQEKGTTDPDASRKSRLGNMLKDAPSIKDLKDNAAETLKRPLTGLFRRPGSRAGGARKKEEEEDGASAAQPPPNFRPSTKFTSALEDVVLNDESPRGGKEADRGDVSTRTQIGNETIARAPAVSSAKLQSMLGDDGISSKLSYLIKVDDNDTSILTRHVLPEEDVFEEVVPWTWDHLYASLSSELRDEWAADNDISLSAR